jgi:hypothetical protein
MSSLQRTDLSGQWTLVFDEGAEWQDVALHPPGTNLDQIESTPPTGGWEALNDGLPIVVPTVAETVRPGYHGVTWWSRSVDVPAARHLVLEFAAARLLVEVYWDHELIGYDLEGYTPFSITVPAHLAGTGVHQLDVRITNPGGSDNWEDAFPLEWAGRLLPSSHDFGGIWQPVHMVVDHGASIDDIYVRPTPSLDAAMVDVWVTAEAPGNLELSLEDPSGAAIASTSMVVDAGTSQHEHRFEVSSPELYAPGSPRQYLVVASLETKAADDSATAAFGFRLLRPVGRDLELNGEYFYARTAISWGWYEDGPIPSAAEIKSEAASIAALGQNMLSAHRMPSTPALLDALEERGLLLYQEPGGGPSVRISPWGGGGQWGEGAELEFAVKLWEERVRRLVRRDRNRACLVWWNLANEVFEVDEGEPGPWARKSLAALRKEDDSRLTTWTSAWGPTPMMLPGSDGSEWSFDYHMIANWPSGWNERIEEEIAVIRSGQDVPHLSGESANFNGLGGLMDFASQSDRLEGSAPWLLGEWATRIGADLTTVDPTDSVGGLQGLVDGIAEAHGYGAARLVDASRTNPSISGLAVNGWHSHPRIGTMGLVDIKRQLAFPPDLYARQNAATALVVRQLVPDLELGTEQPRAEIVLVDDTGAITADPMRVDVIGSARHTGEVVFRATETRVPERGEHPRLWNLGRLSCPSGVVGLVDIRVEVSAGHSTWRTDAEFLAVDVGAAPARSIGLHDPTGHLRGFYESRDLATHQWRLDDSGPAIINATQVRALRSVFSGPARRAAILLAAAPQMAGTTSRLLVTDFVNFDLAQLGLAQQLPEEVVMNGDWLGCWAFSTAAAARVLPSLGHAGVWGWAMSSVFPQRGLRGVDGIALAGGLSFPTPTPFNPGAPAIGATATLLERGGHEVLLTTLPIVDQATRSPLARALLMDVARWVAEGVSGD